MNINKLLISLGIIAAVSSPMAQASTLPLNPKIDQFVIRQLATKSANLNAVLVVMKEQADLRNTNSIPDRSERAHYVYDTLRTTALSTQGPLVEFLKANNVKFHQYYIENMIAVFNPTPELVSQLAARNDVARVKGNPTVKLKLPKQPSIRSRSNNEGNGPEGNVVRMGATKVWENFNDRGEGIVIAGQDTGVEWTHPALKKKYRGYSKDGKVDHNYNWHDAIHTALTPTKSDTFCGYETKAPCDDHGHGTHTIGTVVGDDGKGNQIGVAPNARWIACKNMDQGMGSPASYIECFEFFLAPYPINGNALTDGDPDKAPNIINNSWGCTPEEGCSGDEILGSLKAMKKAGIYVVASAGNDGPSCSTIQDPPAYHTGLSLTVGAFDHRTDQIAFFSSRGPSSFDGGVGPNIAAPGVNVRSAFPGNTYRNMSGTSMAGPDAVGVVALLWSYNKDLIGDIDKTTSILENNAEPTAALETCGGVKGSHIPNNTFGYGIINAYKAVCSQSDKCPA